MSSLCISSQFQKFGVHLTGKKNPFFICSVHLLSLDNSAWDDLGPEELSPVIPVGNKSMFSDPESWFVFMVSFEMCLYFQSLTRYSILLNPK